MKRLLTIILTFIITLTSVPVSVYGKTATPIDKVNKEKDDQLRQTVNDVTFLLKEVMQSKYDGVVQEVKEMITSNGYDFTLSMESFYDQPNPLKDADCIKYLAAYMSCKNYAKQKSIAIASLRDIPFIQYTYQIHNAVEYIPTKIDDYIQDTNVQDEYIKNPGKKYITEQTEVPIYVQQKNGHYKKTDDTTTIIPDSKKISFISVSLSAITPDDIFVYLNIDKSLVKDDYENRVKRISEVTTNEAITQTIIISLPSIDQLKENDIIKYEGYFAGQEGIRKAAVETALSLAGKVPYEWGGKASGPGYDPKWWTYNEKNGLQHGLDCSGFVQWTMMTTGVSKETYSKMNSTSQILSSGLNRIEKSELLPGDIGVTNRPADQVNHVGIYLGNDMWIHCSSTKRTVTVSKLDNLSVFYNPYSNEDISNYNDGKTANYINSYNITKNIDIKNSIYYTHNYENEEILLLAKLIYHEARGEGLDGWIGVAEVIANRIASSAYPNTIREVIYQSGQFEGKEYIESCTPTSDMISVAQMVLSGNLKVLDNPNCLFFRNPKTTDGIAAEIPIDWGSHKWFKAINNHAFYVQ